MEQSPNTLEADTENVEKKTTQSWLKEKLLNALEPILNSIGFNTEAETNKDQLEPSFGYDDLITLNKETGEFFRGLIPQGLREVDNPNVPKLGRKNEMIDDLFKETFLDGKKPFESELIEHPAEIINAEGIDQIITRAVPRQEGNDLIYERVKNFVDKDNKRNSASSSLVFQNVDTGMTLDLNALLPEQFYFRPFALSQSEEKAKNLKDYKGPATPGDFSVISNGTKSFVQRGAVEYGDLTETGGMLTLFHEIAHTWQESYFDREKTGGSTFKETYKEIQETLHRLAISEIPLILAKERGIEPLSEDVKKQEDILGQLKEIGIDDIVRDESGSCVRQGPMKEEGVISISTHRTALGRLDEIKKDPTKPEGFFAVRSVKLQKILDSYIADERDAWAHALRTLRFLRSKGLDIESGLKTLDDIKAKIDPCLESYQESLYPFLETNDGDRRFARINEKKQ